MTIPEKIISGTEGYSKKMVIRVDKEQQRLIETSKKYGGEFGGIEPEERRN